MTVAKPKIYSSECNLIYLKQWVDISSVLFAFPIRSNVIINNITMISAIHATKAKQNLYVAHEIVGV
jgi:hypothetical protein